VSGALGSEVVPSGLPLAGVRVVEVAQYVAGPLCAALLAELGADVVKVEPPGGDAYRGTTPLAEGFGRFFVPLNRGKRSIVLDLKSDVGRGRLAALLGRSDVVVHNAPADRARTFGLDWDRLHSARPELVMGVVTSFGPHGPLATAPAYDLVAQARAGLLTAHASQGDDVPVRAGGIPMADITAGLLLASGVLAALVQARETGEGQRVEVSLLAAALAVQVQDLVWLEDERGAGPLTATRADLTARADEIATGLATNPYYRCYETADGFVAVACLNRGQRAAFAALLEIDDPTIDAPDVLPDDPRVVAVKRAVTATVEERLRAAPTATWLERLAALGVPSGPVHARERVLHDAQVRDNGLLADVEQPGLGLVTMLGRTFGLAGADGPVGAAPRVGEHTEAVLREVGAE
jgi:crotonobetainyl-CoA:carnitine CoA-transferase CaiB-like acyl-CoA transferase